VRGRQSYEQIIQAPDYDRHRPVSYMTALDVDTVYDTAVKLLAGMQAPPPP
jgi:hypothetical protein